MNQQTYLLFLAIHLLFPSTCDNKINLTPFLNPYTLGKAYLIYVWRSWNTHGQLLAVVTNYASHANYGQSLKGHTPLNIRTHLIKAAATISSSALALGLFATTAWAAPAATITLDKDTVSWGDTVNVTVTGLDTTKGYYLLFCEAHPKKFPICVKNGKNAKSHLRINNNVTDAGGVRINKDGVATSPLEITKKDTTLTGPVPNPFVITCATGCRIALTYDHPTSAKEAKATVPMLIADTPITVK